MNDRQAYQFGEFELQPDEHRLLQGGRVVPLTPKAFDTLRALAENAGRLMTKDALMARVWPDAFVEEVTLAQCVSVIRRALGDSPEGARYIETVPKRGYRFIAAVSIVLIPATPLSPAVRPEGPAIEPTAGVSTGRHLPARAAWLLGIALAAVLAAAMVYLRSGVPAVTPRPIPLRVKLAVLPLANLDGNSDIEYLSDGITDELITELGALQADQLGVIARASAMRYKGSTRTIAEIGRELSVGYLIVGSIRREHDRVRVNLQLVQASDQTQLWSDSFDHGVADTLAMQARILRGVVHQIQLKLSVPAATVRTARGTANPEAYDLYLRANYFWNKRNPDMVAKAVSLYEQATGLDPTYARAYAELSLCHLSLLYGSPRDSYGRSAAAARQALSIDDTLDVGHFALASAALHLFDWDTAAREFKRAEELNPASVNYDFQVIFGHFDDSMAHLRRAIELDPLNAQTHHGAGITSFYARRFDAAAAYFREALELEPQSRWSRVRLGQTYAQLGRYDEAIAALRDLDTIGMATVQAMAGRRAEALAILNGAIDIPGGPDPANSWEFALAFAALKQRDDAFRWLGAAFDAAAYQLVYLKVDPRLDSLRGDPRFAQLERRIGFPPF